jgi:hypothetical protein
MEQDMEATGQVDLDDPRVRSVKTRKEERRPQRTE